MQLSSHASLFGSIQQQDCLHLFKDGKPDAVKVTNILKYNKSDVAAATGIPKDIIRFDDKMRADLEERMTEWAVAIALVADFFKDYNKTFLWFQTPNPLLGNVAPRIMIRMGRFNKLLKFIQIALSENK